MEIPLQKWGSCSWLGSWTPLYYESGPCHQWNPMCRSTRPPLRSGVIPKILMSLIGFSLVVLSLISPAVLCGQLMGSVILSFTTAFGSIPRCASGFCLSHDLRSTCSFLTRQQLPKWLGNSVSHDRAAYCPCDTAGKAAALAQGPGGSVTLDRVTLIISSKSRLSGLSRSLIYIDRQEWAF